MPWINPLMANFWVIALMANLLIIYNFEKKKFRFVRFWFFLLIIITTKQDLFYSVFEIVFCLFKFFSTHSTGKNGTEIEAKTFFWVAPSPLWSENSRRSKVASENSRRSKVEGREEKLLECTAFALVWKVRPRSGKSGMSCRVQLDLENRAASALSGKFFFWVAPSPLWSENSRSIHRRSRGKASWMHRVCLGLESQTKIWKVRNVLPRPTWSGKSRCLRLVQKIVPRSIREQNLHSKSFCRDVLIFYLTSWAYSWSSRADSYATFRVDGATVVGRFDFSLIA